MPFAREHGKIYTILEQQQAEQEQKGRVEILPPWTSFLFFAHVTPTNAEVGSFGSGAAAGCGSAPWP